MKRIFVFILIVPLFMIGNNACKKKVEKPISKLDTAIYNPTAYHFVNPTDFPYMQLSTSNPMTVEGIRLGRMLYYDNIIDKYQARSCGTCHHQDKAFSTPGNIIPHINIGYSSYFLWNGGVKGTIEDAMKFEVEEFFETNVSYLNADAEYPYYFFKAFGTKQITAQQVAYALAQFIRTLVSGNSKFDKFLREEVNFSNQELDGFNLFYSEAGDCFHCHGVMLFTDQDFHNTGLDTTFTEANYGRYTVTGNPMDKGKFKTPTLRNIELTGPYMHDGRFHSLEQVIDFYNAPTVMSATLDPIMSKPNHLSGLNLTDYQKQSLIAFLKTLTDTSFTINTDFSNPF